MKIEELQQQNFQLNSIVQELQRDLTEKRNTSANSSFSANHRSDYQHDSEMSERDRMEWKIQSELLRKDLEALKDQQSWKVESQNLYKWGIGCPFDSKKGHDKRNGGNEGPTPLELEAGVQINKEGGRVDAGAVSEDVSRAQAAERRVLSATAERSGGKVITGVAQEGD